ncbi:hypothetical protein [Alienimonas chondri]|uniref:Prisilkin-39 n=1 Tax=Alienimonas chondri TaxID=2681879 RepID=A0ABX1VB61_9PLAN|nr:hypothetical protein [Alienimonas chondri]NNJ25289.1 hypothetical protein [Alienimonas chondri]
MKSFITAAAIACLAGFGTADTADAQLRISVGNGGYAYGGYNSNSYRPSYGYGVQPSYGVRPSYGYPSYGYNRGYSSSYGYRGGYSPGFNSGLYGGRTYGTGRYNTGYGYNGVYGSNRGGSLQDVLIRRGVRELLR